MGEEKDNKQGNKQKKKILEKLNFSSYGVNDKDRAKQIPKLLIHNYGCA